MKNKLKFLFTFFVIVLTTAGLLRLVAPLPVNASYDPRWVVNSDLPGLGSYSNLVIENDVSNPTYQMDITADGIVLRDSANILYQALSVSLTADISAAAGVDALDVGSEAASEFYDLYVIWDGTTLASLLRRSTITSVTDGTTADKLEDSAADFITDKVTIGDKIVNTTDGTNTTVTAIDDLDTLSVADDIFTTGENYRLELARDPTMPSGYTFKKKVGSVYNDGSSNLWLQIQVGRTVRLGGAGYNQFLSSGSSTSYIELFPLLPPGVRTFYLRYIDNTATMTLYLSIDGSADYFLLQTISGVSEIVQVPVSVNQSIYYKKAGGGGTFDFYLAGWEALI